MSEKRDLYEMTADYVLENRDSGWLGHALQVLGSEPYLRRTLLAELCRDVRERVAKRLADYHCVTYSQDPDSWWFSLRVTHPRWGRLSVGLRNTKEDASNVLFGVCNDSGDPLGEAASSRIRECLGKYAFIWKREPKWIGNIWLDPWDWKDVAFLTRVAEEREAVVGEVADKLVEVVKKVHDVLIDRVKETN